MKNPKSILITGASSGIGKALATEYATNGTILYLSGRNKDRLHDIKNECENKGAKVHAKVIDVIDKVAMEVWISNLTSLDLAIANAGISSGVGGNIREIFKTNVDGVFNTVEPALKIMKNQGYGQIAIVSSIAGFRGLPSSPAYSASKSAVKAYGEALRGQYYGQNIEINVICPGFVRSHITDQNNFKMPFFMEADKAAKIIRKGLERNKGLIIFPWQMKLLTSFVFNMIPEFLLERFLRKLPSK